MTSTVTNEHSLQVTGGQLAVPLTDKENTELYDKSKNKAGFCSGYQGSSYMWLGADDQNIEGTWQYIESRDNLTWEGPWRGDGPNGGTVENCLVLLHGAFPGKWSDMACLPTYSFCVPCEYKTLSTMSMKGAALCETSPFNTKYLVIEIPDKRPFFQGYFHSDISWDSSTSSWVIKSLKVSI